jgi:hypothetical protein
LSNGKLIEALASEATLSLQPGEHETLATVAEYFQSNRGDRQQVLNKFGDILKMQGKGLRAPPSIHEAILDMPPPWLLINTNYDLLLEQRLKDEGIPFVLVSHILRSKSGNKDGWLLKIKCQDKEKTGEAYDDANKLVLDPYDYDPDKKAEAEAAERRVIYKMLGSPLFQDCLDDEEWIDTVVLTETDDATFLGMLEKEASKMPDSFAKALKENKNRHILFFGYTLDYWHYRLIVNVFNKNGIFNSPRRRPYAVRSGMPVMEKAFWDRLQAVIFALDLESAAKTLRSAQNTT